MGFMNYSYISLAEADEMQSETDISYGCRSKEREG